MLKIFDRYLIREVLVPLVIGLVVLTFVLEIPKIVQELESLIAKGVEWSVIARLLVLLLPSSLSITLPMSVLLGILIAFGRLSGDREFVAMQACGVSMFRLLRPIGLIAIVGLVATAYEIIIALPNANQTYREIAFSEVASHVESSVKPRVFSEYFPNQVLYVRDLPAGGGWRDVFLADLRQAGQTTVYLAREGRIHVDRQAKTVQLQLKDGTRHTTLASKPDEYEAQQFEQIVLSLDAQTVFPPPPTKGAPEMTIAELRRTIADEEKAGRPAYSERFMIQYKYSFPMACLVLAVIGVGLGVSNRKDGKLASFALGFVVIFAYYVLLYMSRAAAMGSKLNPDLAPWIPHLVLGTAGVGLLLWRSRSGDQPIRISLPAWPWMRSAARPDGGAAGAPAGSRRVLLVVKVPQLNLPRPTILDAYIGRQYARVFFIGLFALLGVFYIATFIDLADKLFRGQATSSLLLRYFFYQTPQFVYYVIPMAALVAALVTVGVMTKNSEIIVMRACGVSLYRTAAPLLVFAVAASLTLFGLEERVLAGANREADRLNSIIRGFPVQTFGELNRRWIIGRSGDIYHYDAFESVGDRFTHFTAYDVSDVSWRIDAVLYADRVVFDRAAASRGGWRALNGWARRLSTTTRKNTVKTTVTYSPFTERPLSLEPPSYFKTDAPDALKMTYQELGQYIAQLKASGFNAVPQMVQLQRKVAFPFVTVIMTLIAVPFAVTTGRRGALYGVGVGIVLAIVYWVALSIFGALGEGGVMPPTLAAWAPNILFGAAAVYLVLTVRT